MNARTRLVFLNAGKVSNQSSRVNISETSATRTSRGSASPSKRARKFTPNPAAMLSLRCIAEKSTRTEIFAPGALCAIQASNQRYPSRSSHPSQG